MTMLALFPAVGDTDSLGVTWAIGSLLDANPLLADHHYLGPVESGGSRIVIIGERDGATVAVQVWRHPTSRNLPASGTWLELSRWCLTPDAGRDAGSRQHRAATRIIRDTLPSVTSLVSYSDPSQGHTGALYRACNWQWWPTWHRLRPPPSGYGEWSPGERQEVKDRWVFPLRKDPSRPQVLHIEDRAAIRAWERTATVAERRWARTHPQLEGLTA